MTIDSNIEFKDYFSEDAKAYSLYRPGYPKELFLYLSSLTQCNARAWDCATGSGQSAIELSGYFSEVIATDASNKQIENAIEKNGILYRVEHAEKTTIENNSVDLITVAQAVHWFKLKEFSNEVNRVLKIKGVLAVWTYGLLDINPELNKVINHLYDSMLNPYWPPERKIIEDGYQDINFSLDKVKTPIFQMETKWTLSQLIGYLCTWSAVKKYQASEGINPVESLIDDISNLWGDPEQTIVIQWPLILKAWIKNT